MSHIETTSENSIDRFEQIRDMLDKIEQYHASGTDDKADAAMFSLKELMNSLHNHIWMQHHRSGTGKI